MTFLFNTGKNAIEIGWIGIFLPEFRCDLLTLILDDLTILISEVTVATGMVAGLGRK